MWVTLSHFLDVVVDIAREELLDLMVRLSVINTNFMLYTNVFRIHVCIMVLGLLCSVYLSWLLLVDLYHPAFTLCLNLFMENGPCLYMI